MCTEELRWHFGDFLIASRNAGLSDHSRTESCHMVPPFLLSSGTHVTFQALLPMSARDSGTHYKKGIMMRFWFA